MALHADPRLAGWEPGGLRRGVTHADEVRAFAESGAPEVARRYPDEGEAMRAYRAL